MGDYLDWKIEEKVEFEVIVGIKGWFCFGILFIFMLIFRMMFYRNFYVGEKIGCFFVFEWISYSVYVYTY